MTGVPREVADEFKRIFGVDHITNVTLEFDSYRIAKATITMGRYCGGRWGMSDPLLIAMLSHAADERVAGRWDVASVLTKGADEIERLRAALAIIALEEADDYPSSIAYQALGSPPTHKLWEMVKAVRAAGGEDSYDKPSEV